MIFFRLKKAGSKSRDWLPLGEPRETRTVRAIDKKKRCRHGTPDRIGAAVDLVIPSSPAREQPCMHFLAGRLGQSVKSNGLKTLDKVYMSTRPDASGVPWDLCC